MSMNTSGAPCYTCAHGSMCNIRDQYLKFFEHRDRVMCKCGKDDSTDNVVDTSNEVQIYVEHRYLNGPGLEDLYRRLGLSAPTYCCMVPQNRCPLHRPGVGSYDRDYFDSPIMNKWNSPIGYISSICEPEKWESHKTHIKRPFIPLNDPCLKCFTATGEKPRSADMIAGSPYSTFAVTPIKVGTGTSVHACTIDPPENIMAGYVVDKDQTIGETVVEGEDTKIIIYYRYMPKDMTPPSPGLWIDDQHMEEKGLMHNVAIVYGNLSAYTYRPFKKDPDFTFIPHDKRITCRIISVKSAYRRLSTKYVPGDEMAMTKLLVPNEHGHPDTKHLQYVVAEKRDTNVSSYPFIPSGSEYVELRVAEGDTIDFEIAVPDTHNLFFKAMEYMDCCPELISTHFNHGRIEYHLRYVVKDHDKTLHMCLINLDDKNQFGNLRIDYPDLNQNGISLAPYQMLIAMDNGQEYTARTKIAPRVWNDVDEDHVSWSKNLPDTWMIERKGFKLAGFVDAVADAISFDVNMDIKIGVQYEDQVFHDVWFAGIGDINTREPGHSAFAKWQIDFGSLFTTQAGTMVYAGQHDYKLIENGPIISLAAEDHAKYQTDMVEYVPILRGCDAFIANCLPPVAIRGNSLTDIKATVQKLYEMLLDENYFNIEDFNLKIAILPEGSKRIYYRNGASPLTYEAEVFYDLPKDPEEEAPEADPDDASFKDDGFCIPDEPASMARDVEIGEGEVDPWDDEEEAPKTVPSTPLTPATPSGDVVPARPLIPATPTGDEVPAIPLTPATPTKAVRYLEALQLNGIDELNELEPRCSAVIMFIEPKDTKAFFMDPHQFSYAIQPLYITLEKCPVEVGMLFDSEKVGENETIADHLLDITIQGLDPIHWKMMHEIKGSLEVKLDPDHYHAPYLDGDLAKYYYIRNYASALYSDIKVNYVYRGERVKQDGWRVSSDQMAGIDIDVSSTGLYFKEVHFKMGREGADATLLLRDPDGHVDYMREIGGPGYSPEVTVHCDWVEDNPNALKVYFDAKRPTVITVELQQEQPDPNAYCARCAGYVDTSTEEFTSWLSWVPDCLKYTPLH